MTDSYSLTSQPAKVSASNNRDDRRPLMEQTLAIDNNTLNSIINSIIQSNPSNPTTAPSSSSTPTTTTTTRTATNNNESVQYLLPVDLLVSVDKSNKPTVQAAIPSTFAFQQQLPLQYNPISPISPIPQIPSIHATYPTYPIYQTPQISQLPQLPQLPQIAQIPSTPPISQTIQMSQSLQSVQSAQSKLNPSAASFTPYTPFTPIAPILEQQNVEENAENNTSWNDMDDEKVEEKYNDDNDDDNDNDQWCIYDDIEQQHQSKQALLSQTVDSKSSKLSKPPKPPKLSQNKPIPQQTTYTAPFKRKSRCFSSNIYDIDHRKYDKNWRNHRNKPFKMNNNNNNNNINRGPRLLVEFIKHVTLPNRQQYPANTVLTKTWMMKNIGQIEWGYNVELVYCKGDETLSLYSRYPVINAQPGQEVEISATIKTSKIPGRYCTYFRLQKNGKFFGPRIWCDVIVANSNENPLDGRTKKCADDENKNHNDDNNKVIKWKKKYGTNNEAHNHYKVVSCK